MDNNGIMSRWRYYPKLKLTNSYAIDFIGRLYQPYIYLTNSLAPEEVAMILNMKFQNV